MSFTLRKQHSLKTAKGLAGHSKSFSSKFEGLCQTKNRKLLSQLSNTDCYRLGLCQQPGADRKWHKAEVGPAGTCSTLRAAFARGSRLSPSVEFRKSWAMIVHTGMQPTSSDLLSVSVIPNFEIQI